MTENRFIAYLRGLADRQDRGALAALRRGLSRPPGTAAEMHPYVVPFLPEGWAWRHQCHYIIAALFALHPQSTGQGNLGEAFRRIAAQTPSESIEQRFVALLKSHRDDLFDHLRHAVGLAKSNDAAICWETLFRDIQHWDDDRRRVQRNWARSFWGGAGPQPQTAPTAQTTEGG